LATPPRREPPVGPSTLAAARRATSPSRACGCRPHRRIAVQTVYGWAPARQDDRPREAAPLGPVGPCSCTGQAAQWRRQVDASRTTPCVRWRQPALATIVAPRRRASACTAGEAT